MNDTELKKTIAENLKRFRKEHNLSQSELGAKFGKEKTTISTWERAESMPDIVTLHKLAKLYDVRLEDFYVQDYTLKTDIGEIILESKTKKRLKKRITSQPALSIQKQEEPKIGYLNGMPVVLNPPKYKIDKKKMKQAKVSDHVKDPRFSPGETGPATI